jgi:Ca-activated chloride channel family protein
VEHLWARRKVGYMLDQIRANGEKKELVEEVVLLAKKYGIATPYTSYLVVPDGPTPVVNARPHRGPLGAPGAPVPEGLARPGLLGPAKKVADFAKEQGDAKGGGVAQNRGKFEADKLKDVPMDPAKDDKDGQRLAERKRQLNSLNKAREAFGRRDINGYQAGEVGVDLSIQSNQLKGQNQLTRTAVKNVGRRNCLDIGGVWIDAGFDAKMKTVVVKAQSNAYFRMLERRPELKEVFQLGNHLVWVTPSGTALVIDTNDGKDELSDADIDALFVTK